MKARIKSLWDAILAGAATFTLFPDNPSRPMRRRKSFLHFEKSSTEEILASDWRAVGDDMRKVMGDLASSVEQELRAAQEELERAAEKLRRAEKVFKAAEKRRKDAGGAHPVCAACGKSDPHPLEVRLNCGFMRLCPTCVQS